MTQRIFRQIDWARAEATRQRKLAVRHAANPRARDHARRMAVLAETTVVTLTELATQPAPAAYRNRLNLWMIAPDAAQLERETAS